mmetsp:Transcript_1131/g.2970  ORF Transcript_1131/g.2970 Transcript_1131/m.2970 type:complete len:202 (-) Transcript_1131:166-771(-)
MQRGFHTCQTPCSRSHTCCSQRLIHIGLAQRPRDAVSERPLQVQCLLVELECEARLVGECDVALVRQRLLEEHGAKVRVDRVGLLRHYHKLGERHRRESHRHVVAIDATAVRDERHTARRRQRDDASKLGHAAHPHHIGLQEVDARVDQLVEAPARVLVLACRKVRSDAHALQLLREACVRGVLVRHQRLLDPRHVAACLL